MSVPFDEAGRPYVHGPASLETQARQDLVEPGVVGPRNSIQCQQIRIMLEELEETVASALGAIHLFDIILSLPLSQVHTSPAITTARECVSIAVSSYPLGTLVPLQNPQMISNKSSSIRHIFSSAHFL